LNEKNNDVFNNSFIDNRKIKRITLKKPLNEKIKIKKEKEVKE
jgi:hypothetical protein